MNKPIEFFKDNKEFQKCAREWQHKLFLDDQEPVYAGRLQCQRQHQEQTHERDSKISMDA